MNPMSTLIQKLIMKDDDDDDDHDDGDDIEGP